MPNGDILPPFEVFDDSDHPSQSHGLLCGMLCRNPALSMSAWLDALETDPHPTWSELYAVTVSQLDDEQLGFYLLLPDDDTGLQERVIALAEWCRGFLSGLGLGGARLDAVLNDDASEIIADFARIAQTELPDDDSGEQDEQDYMQLTEYVRIGALTVAQSCQSAAGPETRSTPYSFH